MLHRLLILLCVVLAPGAAASGGVAVHALRDLPVLESGRVKPPDTLARDTVRFVTGKETFGRVVEEADGSQKVTDRREPLAVLLGWSGGGLDREAEPVLYVPFLELRAKLGMKPAQKWLAPAALRAHGLFW